jgi:hypothetical protein
MAKTHGMRNTAEYGVWARMITRCENPRRDKWEYYGGRGITVSPLWRHDFAAFYAEVGPRPSVIHSIDRIDNDRGYEPGNVRWATKREQRANQRPIQGHSPLRGKRNPAVAGENHYGAKLTDQRVRDIRRWYASGFKQADIAQKLGVTPQTVNLVVKGKSWAHVA